MAKENEIALIEITEARKALSEKEAAERAAKAKAQRQQWEAEALDDLTSFGDDDYNVLLTAIIDGKIRHVTFG